MNTIVTQNTRSSKLYTEYVKAVVEEAHADATLRMGSAQQRRFEAMAAKNTVNEDGTVDVIWA